MAIVLHKAGFTNAEEKIRHRSVGYTSNNWEEVKPSIDDILNYLNSHTLEEYGLWFLGSVDFSAQP